MLASSASSSDGSGRWMMSGSEVGGGSDSKSGGGCEGGGFCIDCHALCSSCNLQTAG
jgi:hypothetical protein